MPAPLPDGDPVPDDGTLPPPALDRLADAPLGIYLHVPFCAVRCGYCDFNTYTPAELGAAGAPDRYLAAALAEIRLARRVLGPGAPAVSTVFVGGGTPTLLPPADLARLLAAVRAEFGLRPDAEVTTEANPESVDERSLAALRAAGFTRLSLGMQSAAGHVLAALDRRHTPGRVPAAVGWARSAGFDQVSLDLIYGAAGETLADWRDSVRAALQVGPDHVSAYALVVEDGTALARRVRRGELPAPDGDDLADKYELADAEFAAAGLPWYEVSNWARPGARCRHNVGYWRGANWWGIGPGAHSHVGGVRWWNRRRPADYADRLAAGTTPAAGRELLGPDERRTERLLLGIRLVDGLAVAEVAGLVGGGSSGLAAAVDTLVGDGLLEVAARAAGRLVLTRSGRLLADAVTRALLAVGEPAGAPV